MDPNIKEKLDALQADALKQMLRPEAENGALLAFDMGLGKTRTGLMLARAMNAQVVLIVVPLQTADDWIDTAESEYSGLPAQQIDSSAPGKRALASFQWRTPGIYVIGQEYWERLAWKKVLRKKKRPTDRDEYRKMDSKQWAGSGFLFMYDESHRSQNVDSWTHKALMNLDPSVFKLSMSGTYEGNSFDGAYGATRWVWPHRAEANIYNWRAEWAAVEYDHFAPRNQKTVGEKNPGAFVSSLPCYIRAESLQPPTIQSDIWIDLGDEQRRVYDELDAQMVAWIQENPLVTEYSITKIARQRQMTLAMPTLTFDGDELIDVDFEDGAESAKIEALFREIDGKGKLGDLMVGEKILLGTDSQKFARLLTAALNVRYGEGSAAEWSGKVSKAERRKVKDGFINGEIKYLVGVQAAMGTGTNGLQFASHIGVYMSRAQSRIANEQWIARLNRTGQEHEVHEIHILANNTLDEGQLSKQMQAALDANARMRRNK